MKIALLLSGLPRKVELGYNKCWKQIIDKYKTDVYLYCWKDEEWELIPHFYKNYKKLVIEEPFSFKKFTLNLECINITSKPYEKYEVAGYQNVFPMMWCWQKIANILEKKTNYDLIILSRFDVETNKTFNLKNLNFEKINLSNSQWKDTEFPSDSLIVINQKNFNVLFKNIFNDLISELRREKVLYWQEKMFLKLIKNKGLDDVICKTELLNHSLIRGRHGYKQII